MRAAVSQPSDVIVTAFVRTPFGRFSGQLADISTAKLGALTVDALLARTKLPAEKVEALYMGVGMIGAATLTSTRQTVLLSKLRKETPSLTVDRACCSAMSAIGLGWRDIKLGFADAVICGGSENLSATPYLWPRRRERSLGDVTAGDPLTLRTPTVDASIAGYTAKEALAVGIDRRMQDEWALASHQKFFAAEQSGYFDAERMHVDVPGPRGGSVRMTTDEGPRSDTSLEKLGALKTIYGAETITPGNAPGLNDGAAFLLLVSERIAKEHDLPILARIAGYSQVADGPTSGSYTPAIAISKLLAATNRDPRGLDAIEINEAFAATPLVSTLRLAEGDEAAAEKLRRKTNQHGGAVAIGHPIGASGARLAMTLVNTLQRRGGGRGATAICGGFGQGDALLIDVPA
jgi:acetyl-CoA C-acetyltransferase